MPGDDIQTHLLHARLLRPFSGPILLLLLLLLLVPQPFRLGAQVLQTDIISAYRDSDSSAFNALLQFNLSLEQQLNTVVNLGAGADLRWHAGDDAIILGSKAKRTYAGDLRVTNSGYAHLRYRRDRAARTGADLFTQYQWDGPRGMRSRTLLGANLRHGVLRDSTRSLDVAAGVMYELERWGYDGVAERDRPADQSAVSVRQPRINTYVRYQSGLTAGVSLLVMNYVQTRVDGRFDEPRIASSARLIVDVTESVSLTIAYNSIYDFAPVVPIRRFYFDIANGVAVRL